MTYILIKTDSHYKVNRKRIRRVVADYLREKKVKTMAELSIAVVGDRQMKKLNLKYRNLDKTTDVLSFPLSDDSEQSKFVEPPDEILRLGDIVLSYPQVIDEASNEDKFVDDKIDELIIHGLNHLFGYHHD